MDKRIAQAIPHRPPFLFVDEIVSLTDTSIVTRLLLKPEMEFFKGHYPSNPIFPGVLSCEAIMQTGAILASHILSQEGSVELKHFVPVVTRMNRVKFRRQMVPGDVIQMEAILQNRLSDVFFMAGHINHKKQKVVSMEFASKLAHIEDLDLNRKAEA